MYKYVTYIHLVYHVCIYIYIYINTAEDMRVRHVARRDLPDLGGRAPPRRAYVYVYVWFIICYMLYMYIYIYIYVYIHIMIFIVYLWRWPMPFFVHVSRDAPDVTPCHSFICCVFFRLSSGFVRICCYLLCVCVCVCVCVCLCSSSLVYLYLLQLFIVMSYVSFCF